MRALDGVRKPAAHSVAPLGCYGFYVCRSVSGRIVRNYRHADRRRGMLRSSGRMPPGAARRLPVSRTGTYGLIEMRRARARVCATS